MSLKGLKISIFSDFDHLQKKQDQEMLALSINDRIRLAVEMIKRVYSNTPATNTKRTIEIISS